MQSIKSIRYALHELHSFGHGCRRMGSKPSVSLCEQVPKKHSDFIPV